MRARCILSFASLVLRCYRCPVPEVADPIVRKTVSLPASVWRQVEDYQFANRVKRETEAIRRLIELGLEATKHRESAE